MVRISRTTKSKIRGSKIRQPGPSSLRKLPSSSQRSRQSQTESPLTRTPSTMPNLSHKRLRTAYRSTRTNTRYKISNKPQFSQTPKTFPIYRASYAQAIRGIRQNLSDYSYSSTHAKFYNERNSVRSSITQVPYNKQLVLTNSDEYKKEIAWPTELAQGNVYVITIRTDRWNRMRTRLGNWAKYVKRFQGTNGNTINARSWYNEKKLGLKHMKRGRIGCYDSHVRVWKTIQQTAVPFALVLEDDADFGYSSHLISRIQGAIRTLGSHAWDVLLLGHYNDRKYKPGLGNGISRATKWQPMHAYLISQTGVKKLLKNAMPIRHALDVYVGSQMAKGLIMYRMEPRLCGQLRYGHDTEAIK